MKPQTWQERYYKRFSQGGFGDSEIFIQIETFISVELQRAREEGIEEAIGAVPEERNIVGKLEHLIKSGTSKSTRRKHTSIGHGFNECRHETLTALQALIVKK